MVQDDDTQVGIIEFSEDISEQEAPIPLPIKQYPATIRKVEVKDSEKGTRYAAVHFFIDTNDYPADYPTENAPDGTTLIFRRVGLEDTAQSRYRLRKFCETIGAPASKRINVSDWVNLVATVAVKHEAYEGENRAVIEKVLAA